MARRTLLTTTLDETASRLRRDQGVRSALAAAQERNRVARELHDVVAHSLSVMVIQASAARVVAHKDPAAAAGALRAVAESGREAMVDLRRLMGVLRHDDDALAAGQVGVAELRVLVERVRAAGVDTELRIEGQPMRLPAAVETTAYRVVQEALTNVVKHVGPTRVCVVVAFCERALEVGIADTGPASSSAFPETVVSGHGLVGMQERVAVHGGDLHAGPTPGGGWAVDATIPLAPTATRRAPQPREPAPDHSARLSRVLPWLDRALAAVSLTAFEIEVVTSPYGIGRSLIDMVVVAVIATATLWRRRAPLAFLAGVGLLAVSLSGGPISLHNQGLLGGYMVLVPTYAVAAWEERRRALLGLGIWLVGAVVINLLSHAQAADLLGGIAMGCAVWAVGRVARNQRQLGDELAGTAALLRSERQDRTRLAVAAERTRIAREVHGLVARGVIAKVVQAESAQTIVTSDPVAAIAAAAAIEGSGREALAEMRHILGALRAPDRRGDLQPLPGLDQIHGLLERSRAAGRIVELTVEGEPGPVFAGVDVAAYRIIEEILAPAHNGTIGITMRFSEDNLELDVLASSLDMAISVRDRVAMCDGELIPGDDRVLIRLPRKLQATLA